MILHRFYYAPETETLTLESVGLLCQSDFTDSTEDVDLTGPEL